MTKRIASRALLNRDNLGFLLAKASQRWNELLAHRFAAAGFAEVRPSYGSVLLPLYEEDGLRMGELARRSRLSKQTMTDLVRRLERDRLVTRAPDPMDGRASLIYLTARARAFAPVAADVLADLERLVVESLSPRRAAALARELRTVMELGTETDAAGGADRPHFDDTALQRVPGGGAPDRRTRRQGAE